MRTRKKWSWFTWALIVFAAAILVLGVIVPNYVRVTHKPVSNACTNFLQRIQEAKQAWAKETGADGSAVPSLSDITPYLGRHASRATTIGCPSAGLPDATNFARCYEIHAVTNLPTCKIMPRSHVLEEARPHVRRMDC